MDLTLPTTNDGVVAPNEKEPFASLVDPFLVEALQNPRHRVTILRMELDIQKFLRNSDQQQFEFQHFPTSYLRLAAHRVAQHYGLQTVVQDNILDGLGARIMARKMVESRYPAVCLSEIPAKQSENDKHEQIKIVIKPRPNKAFLNGASELGSKRSPVRTVEERKEEYDRARARIFSGPSSPESEHTFSQSPLDVKNLCLGREEHEGCRNSIVDPEKAFCIRDIGSSSRVAIFRDREKDRTDPDYDRNYERYVKSIPANQNSSLMNMQKFQPPFVQYDTIVPKFGQMPRSQASINFRTPAMSPFCTTGLNQTAGDAVYMQWPTPAMMYAQSYDQFRHAVFQAPYCQQPLSFNYSQNH
ncbi:uncharacterized protein LOC132290075 [Cornus florida]|uniref:uncharacterized protein LOC132290075 n=1 Tax=Cornus florida TaxID=4283 RepID=UPI00289A3A66|nr:uncharacterized protein LOC132290075 [Cornus florida]